MNYKSFLSILGLFFSIYTSAQLQTVKFNNIEKLQNKTTKNVFVFIYTDWCKYCEMMEQITLNHAEISSKLNQDFYTIKLNAEEKEPISFGGKKFYYKPSGHNTGLNDLALALGEIDGQITFPTICILNAKNEILFQYQGFLKVDELKKILEAL